jgi:excisionase family DNA binding protein
MARLLTSAEAAQQLGVSKTTIHRWAATGTLAYVRKLDGLRGGYVFDSTDISAYQRARTPQPTRTAAAS